MAELLTLRQFREHFGIQLSVGDFIAKPEPCEPRWAYFPVPKIPKHLMDADKADKTEELFNKCVGIVGDAFGSFSSKRDTPEFKELACQFKELTGIDPWEIMMEARRRLSELVL